MPANNILGGLYREQQWQALRPRGNDMRHEKTVILAIELTEILLLVRHRCMKFAVLVGYGQL